MRTTSDTPHRERRCARCRFPLRTVDNGAVEVDHCDLCHGTFFDAHDVAPTWGDATDPKRWVRESVAEPAGRTSLRCPHDDEPMHAYRILWREHAPAVLDVCPACSGLWLDEGEGVPMRTILEAYDTERVAAGKHTVRGWLLHGLRLVVAGGLVMEVFHPLKRRAWLTYSLAAAIFGAHLVAWLGARASWEIAETIRDMRLHGRAIQEGDRLWTLLTRALVHRDFGHALGNVYMLWVFGDNIEDRVGRKRIALLLLAAAASSGLAWAATHDGWLRGASGMTSGVLGSYLVLFPRVKLWVFPFLWRFKAPAWGFIGFWLSWNVYGVATDAGSTAWESHLGGFAVGAALGWWFRRSLAQRVLLAREVAPPAT